MNKCTFHASLEHVSFQLLQALLTSVGRRSLTSSKVQTLPGEKQQHQTDALLQLTAGLVASKGNQRVVGRARKYHTPYSFSSSKMEVPIH